MDEMIEIECDKENHFVCADEYLSIDVYDNRLEIGVFERKTGEGGVLVISDNEKIKSIASFLFSYLNMGLSYDSVTWIDALFNRIAKLERENTELVIEISRLKNAN